jgi:hypothetical protein
MNKKIIFIILSLTTFIYSTSSYSFSNFSLGFKAGFNFSKFNMYNESINPLGNYPKYSYPASYEIGIHFETKFSNSISFINEVSFVRIISEITIYTGYEGILNQKYYGDYIHFPFLLKFQTDCFLSPYFLIGPDFGYLLKARYKFFDRIYKDSGIDKITNKLPSINTSINLGVGRKFKLSKISLLSEIRCLFGLTKYENKDIGIWKNNSLQLIFGIQFE